MKKEHAILGIAILLIIAGIYLLVAISTSPSPLDAFARCLKAKGAEFYGAYWCPHCQTQKALFGSAQKFLPYVECSTPDGNGQLQICKDKKVVEYPTWIFADGSQKVGEMSLNELSKKTGCLLPTL